MMKKFLLSLCIIFFFCSESHAVTLSELENAVMCMCPDNCGKVLINCSCKYSDEYRATFAQEIKNGMGKKEIIQAWVEKYGEKGLSAPTKKGFNLTAWIMPFAALFAGGILVFQLMRKWSRRKKSNEIPVNTQNLSQEDKKILEKLNKELKEMDS